VQTQSKRKHGRTKWEVPTPKQHRRKVTLNHMKTSHLKEIESRDSKLIEHCVRNTSNAELARREVRAGATGIWQKSEHVIDRGHETMSDNSVAERRKRVIRGHHFTSLKTVQIKLEGGTEEQRSDADNNKYQRTHCSRSELSTK
jgi:hypothetical protein